MFTITRANKSRGKSGETLPTVWHTLDRAEIRFRRGQVTLIAAAPGVGKSVMALRLAIDTGIPALYFSADTDAFTTNLRAAAMVTGQQSAAIEGQYRIGAGGFYDRRLIERLKLVRFNFTASPDLDEIDQDCQAFAYTFGQWPALVIVDNLSNVYTGETDGFNGLEATLTYLKELGRESGAAILVLHHLTGIYDQGTTAPPLDALRGKISKTPEMILHLFRPGPGLLGVAAVKNRTGKASADGRHYVSLALDLERMSLHD